MKIQKALLGALLLPAFAVAQTWLAPVKSPVRYGLEDEAGVVIVEARFDELIPQGENAWLAKTANGYGILNAKGELVIADKYRKIIQYRNGHAVVARPGVREKQDRRRSYEYESGNDSILKLGVTDKNGKLIADYNWVELIIGPDDIMLVSADGKSYGYLDAQGKELLPVQYDFASVFREERAVVSTGGSLAKGYNNLIYENYGIADRLNSNGYTGGAWEVINVKGEKVTKQTYDYIRDYKEGRAAFNKGGVWNTSRRYDDGVPKLTDGRWGYLDVSGNEVLAAQYDYVGDFENGIAEVSKDDRTFYIDLNGKEVAAPAKKIKTFSYPRVFCKAGYAGYIDPAGKMVIPAVYRDALQFSEGLAAVMPVKRESDCKEFAPEWFRNLYDTATVSMTRTDDYGHYRKPRFMRKMENVYTEKLIYEALRDMKNMKGDSAAKEIPEYYGYVDKTGKLIIPAQFDEALPFSNGRAYVRVRSRWGIIDKTGNWIMKPVLDNPTGIYNGNGLDGYDYVNEYSNYASPATGVNSNELLYAFKEGMGLIYKFQKYGFVNEAGKIIVAPFYDDALPFSSGLAAVRAGEKWGFIDKTGKLVIPLKYTEAFSFSNGVARVKHEIISDSQEENTSEYDRERYGFIDVKGNWVIPPAYQIATDFSEETAAVSETWSSYRYINKAGKQVITGTFRAAGAFTNGYAAVDKTAGKTIYIDHKGNENKMYSLDFPPLGKSSLLLSENKVTSLFGFRNAKKEWIVPAVYETAGIFTNAD